MKYTTPQSNATFNTEQEIAAVRQGVVEFEQHLHSRESKTLAEIWKELGVQEITSPKGYPALAIGDTGTFQMATNTINGLNALADLYTYKQLEWHQHTRWFNPTLNNTASRVIFRDGRWEVFDFSNNAFKHNYVLSLPYHQIKNRGLSNYRRNLEGKHDALDEMLRCRLFGNRFIVVMATQKQLDHYMSNIKAYIEAPYSTYIQKRDERYEDAELASQLNRQSTSKFDPSVPASDARTQFVAMLNAATSAVTILATNPSGRPVERLFDPADENSAKNLISSILKASPVVTFSIKES